MSINSFSLMITVPAGIVEVITLLSIGEKTIISTTHSFGWTKTCVDFSNNILKFWTRGSISYWSEDSSQLTKLSKYSKTSDQYRTTGSEFQDIAAKINTCLGSNECVVEIIVFSPIDIESNFLQRHNLPYW